MQDLELFNEPIQRIVDVKLIRPGILLAFECSYSTISLLFEMAAGELSIGQSVRLVSL